MDKFIGGVFFGVVICLFLSVLILTGMPTLYEPCQKLESKFENILFVEIGSVCYIEIEDRTLLHENTVTLNKLFPVNRGLSWENLAHIVIEQGGTVK